jgi:hypothetical protein
VKFVLEGRKACRRIFGQNGLQNLGSCSLHKAERFGEGGFIARVKLDVIAAGRAGIESDSGGDHEYHCFGFGLADNVIGLAAPLATMEQFVCGLMGKNRKLLGAAQAWQQSDLAAGGQSISWADALIVFERDGFRCDELSIQNTRIDL